MKKEFYEDVVKDVKKDFANRQNARRAYEDGWEVNMNFLAGNQYCTATPALGVINSADKEYYWQETGVFNHIAPIFETRVARLNSVRPKMVVRPSTSSQDDVACAEISTKILSGLSEKIELSKTGQSGNELVGSDGDGILHSDLERQTSTRNEVGRQGTQRRRSQRVGVFAFRVYPERQHVSDISLLQPVSFTQRGTLCAGEDIYARRSSPTASAVRQRTECTTPQRDETTGTVDVHLPTSNRPRANWRLLPAKKLLYTERCLISNRRRRNKDVSFCSTGVAKTSPGACGVAA